MALALSSLVRFAVGFAIGIGSGLAVIVLYYPHPRSVVAGFLVNDWTVVVMAAFLTLMGVLLALEQRRRRAGIVWASAFLILGVGAVIADLSLVNRSRMDQALRAMQQDIIMNVFTRAAANLDRLVTLQTELLATQRKLISTTQSIIEDSRNRTTAGKAYALIVPVLPARVSESGSKFTVLLHAENPSPYLLIDATATIEEQRSPGQTIEQTQEQLRNAARINLGDIRPMSKKPIRQNLTVRKDHDNYFHIAIYSQYVLLTELLVVSWNNGRWNADWSLIRTGDTQWIHQVAEDFPYIDRPK